MVKKKLIVKNFMVRDVITVSSDTTLDELVMLMKECRHHTYPVVDNDRLVGMVSAFDIVTKEFSETVSGIMKTSLVGANENLSVNYAYRIMSKRRLSIIPVLNNDGKLVGILSNSDIVKLFL